MLLHIQAIGAEDVPKMDIIGKSDPYLLIKISSSNKVWKTEYINDTLTPTWNEEFHIPITSANKDELHIELYDHDKFKKDDLIGSYDFKVLDFPVGEVIDKWYQFNPAKGVEKGGKVRLVFHFDNYGVKAFKKD